MTTPITTATTATSARLRELIAEYREAWRHWFVTGCSDTERSGIQATSFALSEYANGVLPALLSQLAAQAAEIERLRAELAVERQCRNGHLPDCAGIDLEQMRCGCGYLDGTAYRSLADEIERLKAECIREHDREFAPFCEQSERADKADARVVALERELVGLAEGWDFDAENTEPSTEYADRIDALRECAAALRDVLAKREGGR